MRCVSILVVLVVLIALAGCGGSSDKVVSTTVSIVGKYNIPIGYVDVAASGASYTADLYDSASPSPHQWHMLGTLSDSTLTGTATPADDPAAVPRTFVIVFSADRKTFTLTLGTAPAPTVWTGTKA